MKPIKKLLPFTFLLLFCLALVSSSNAMFGKRKSKQSKQAFSDVSGRETAPLDPNALMLLGAGDAPPRKPTSISIREPQQHSERVPAYGSGSSNDDGNNKGKSPLEVKRRTAARAVPESRNGATPSDIPWSNIRIIRPEELPEIFKHKLLANSELLALAQRYQDIHDKVYGSVKEATNEGKPIGFDEMESYLTSLNEAAAPLDAEAAGLHLQNSRRFKDHYEAIESVKAYLKRSQREALAQNEREVLAQSPAFQPSRFPKGHGDGKKQVPKRGNVTKEILNGLFNLFRPQQNAVDELGSKLTRQRFY